VLLVPLVAAGCGGGNGAGPEGTVKTYLKAFADGNGKQACDQLTGDAKRQALDYAATNLPELNATSCEDALTAIAKNLGGDEKGLLRDAEISKTTINGSSATVSLKAGSNDAELTKTGGRWYISGGLFQ